MSSTSDLITTKNIETYTIVTTMAKMTTVPTSDVSQSLIGPDEYLMTQTVTDWLRLVLHLIALPMNTVNIFVYAQKNMRSPTSTYHIAMSVAQIIYVLSNLVVPIGRLANLWTDSSYFCVLYSTVLNHFLILSTTRVMYGLICLVSLERLLAIAFPLKAKLFRVCKTPVLSIAFLYLLVFLSNLYFAIKYEIYSSSPGEVNRNNLSSISCDVTVDLSLTNSADARVVDVFKQDLETVSSQITTRIPAGSSISSGPVLTLTRSPSPVTSQTLGLPQTSAATASSLCQTPKSVTVSSATMTTVWASRFSRVYLVNLSAFALWSVAAGVVWVYVAVLLGLMMDVLLVFVLFRYSRQRGVITTSDGNDKRYRQVRQTTLTVLTSSLIFVLLNLLPVSNSLANHLVPSYGYYSANLYTFLFVHALSQLSFSLSLCTDLLTFVLLSSTYRATLSNLIGRMCKSHSGKRVYSLNGKGKNCVDSNSLGTDSQALSVFPTETRSLSTAQTFD